MKVRLAAVTVQPVVMLDDGEHLTPTPDYVDDR